MAIDWERETKEIMDELNELLSANDAKCFECPAPGKFTLNGRQYCESCYLEATGEIKHEAE